MKPDELFAQIKKRLIAPVYFFSGDDEFSKEEAVQQLISAAVAPVDEAFSLDLLNGDDTDATTVLTLAATVPMLTEKRVVVVRSFQRLSQKEREAVVDYAEHPTTTTCLVLTTPRVDLRTKLYTRLGKAAESVVFYQMDPERDLVRILTWLRRRAQNARKRFSKEAAQALVGNVGGDLGNLARELEKLAVYVGDRQTIEAADVDAVIGTARVDTVFDLAQAIGEKDLAEAYRSMDRVMDAGEAPQILIAVLVRHLTILWKIRLMKLEMRSDDDVKKALRQGWWFNRNYTKYLAQAKLLSRPELMSGFEVVLQADVSLKTSVHPPRLIMQRMLYDLCVPQV